MRKNQSNYCALPFVHVAIEGNGEIKRCCVSEAYEADDGTKFNLNTHDLTDLVASKDYLAFRKSFMENEQNPKCSTCWKQEKQGLTSLRKSFSDRYKYLDDEKHDTQPKFIEIKMGNKCNLMCAICHPENSTKWVTEALRRDPNSKAVTANENAKFIQKEKVWESPLIYEAKEFHLMGGEPFAIKETEELLDLLIKNGKPNEIKIWFNTNGSIYPQNLIEKLSLFSEVDISVSIDDINSRMEYQRYYASFERTLKNIKRLGELGSKKFRTNIDICWSTWNTFYFKEISEFAEGINKELHCDTYRLQNCRHFYSGDIYCLNNLDEKEKPHYLKALKKASSELHSGYSGIIDELLHWLNSDMSYERVVLERKIEICKLDQKRKHKFSQVFPELDLFMNQSQFNEDYFLKNLDHATF